MDELLEEDLNELYLLQEEGFKELGEYELQEENWQAQFDKRRTIGERAADGTARIGGSWNFVIGLVSFLLFWIILNGFILPNSIGEERTPDPFPFILLNLFLSFLASFQAPIIMMSQNRQDAKDRIQNDYVSKISLRNEHETRHINAKMDHLLSFQWKRLLEIQEIQTALLHIDRTSKYNKGSSKTKNGRSSFREKKPSKYLNMEMTADPFLLLILRHVFDVEFNDDHFIFSHWHEEGDNYKGNIDNSTLIIENFKLKSISFDLYFLGHQGTLDDIFSGEGRVSFRNDFNLIHMNTLGEISCIEFPNLNPPTKIRNGEFPSRFKPAFATRRKDRISDLWKTPFKKIRITYNPCNQFIIYYIPPQQVFKNITITFFPSHGIKTADLYLLKVNEKITDEKGFVDSVLKCITTSELSHREEFKMDCDNFQWQKVLTVSWENDEEQNSIIEPISDIEGECTIILYCREVRVSMYGVNSQLLIEQQEIKQ